jgi:hypothetical protein
MPNNNLAFIMAQKEMIDKIPELSSYYYQFLLEAAYHKKHFYDSDITLAFDKKFVVKDIYNINGGLSDVSTLNSAFVVSHIINTTSFHKIPFTIYSTPIDYKSKVYELSQQIPKIKKIIELSRLTTGNTNCDIAIGHRLYDIKHIEKDSVNKNHILPWAYEKIEIKGLEHLRHVFGELVVRPDTNINKLLMKELSNIIKEKNFYNIPIDYKLPLVIPMTKKPHSCWYRKKLEKNIISPMMWFIIKIVLVVPFVGF